MRNNRLYTGSPKEQFLTVLSITPTRNGIQMSDVDALIDAVEPTRFTRVKTFVRDHKSEIITGSIGLVVGATAVLLCKSGTVQVINKNSIEHSPNATIKYITQTVIQANFGKVGRPGHRIQDMTTGEMFGSIKEASEKTGFNRQDISRHLKGDRPHVSGHTFKKLIEESTEV